MLSKGGAEVSFIQLKAGDYIINNEIVVERKTAIDFIQSLVSGRLFSQCAQMCCLDKRPLMLIEGNPYQTAHQIDKRAVRGAILSVLTSWQIPIIHSKGHEDSTDILLMLAKQSLQQKHLVHFNCYKPKRIKNHRLKFLQSLPCVGAIMASRLFDYFGSIEAVINADIKSLQKVKGIGKVVAVKIKEFLSEY